MQNNWVLLRGRLCHRPNYTSTQKGLHKVAFRLAVPRLPRSPKVLTPSLPSNETQEAGTPGLPTVSGDSDFVTIIIIGRPAYEFQQLDLQAGAAVRVQGRLRSWDQPRYQKSDEEEIAAATAGDEKKNLRHDYRIEVIAEKVEPIEQ